MCMVTEDEWVDFCGSGKSGPFYPVTPYTEFMGYAKRSSEVGSVSND